MERIISNQRKDMKRFDWLVQLFTKGRRGDYHATINFTQEGTVTSICSDLPKSIKPEIVNDEELANKLFLNLSSSTEEI